MDDRSAQAARRGAPTRSWLKVVALGLLCALAVPATAKIPVAKKKQIARSAFDEAERMREALNGRPVPDRSRKAYQRVIDAYRKVYYTAPNSNRADDSIVAVAELLAEEGRNFDDDKMLHAAIGQYEFLRHEYPGSKNRVPALFAIGQIYADDLGDSAKAKETFNEFLKHYPHAELSDDARAALKAIDDEAAAAKQPKKPNAKNAEVSKNTSKGSKPSDKIAEASDDKPKPDSKPSPKQDAASGSRSDLPAPVRAAAEQADAAADNIDAKTGKPKKAGSERMSPSSKTPDVTPVSQDTLPAETQAQRKGKLPLVTGIRHWSTPDYTRIAVDLEQDVKYEVGRVPDPDRLFFDLHGTKLASGLMGKEYEVQDGLLKKIRVAQFQVGETRIVFDLGEISDYQAFLLPNPYRLIVDVHGKRKPATQSANAKPADKPASAGSSDTAQTSQKKPVDAAQKSSTTTAASKDELSSARAAAAKDSAGTSATDSTKQAAKETAPKEAISQATKAAKPDVTAKPDKVAPEMAQKPTDDSDAPPTRGAGSKSTASVPQMVAANRTPDLPATSETATKSSASKSPRKASSEFADDDDGADAPIAPVISKSRKGAKTPAVHAAEPTASGDRSLIRALGLKIGRVVVDAGHGGHDTGTIGPTGLLEKDLVLDVALRLGKLLESRMGTDVVYTRDDDTFVPLETRTAIANREQADLFISVHANSSRDPGARGVETYYLNFTTSADALDVAARENAVSDTSIHELQDLVKKIALKDKVDESREFAGDVQASLKTGLSGRGTAMRDRGVKKAPFIVLIGANMPSILAEISFLSNPGDEKKLKTPDYRQKIAESLYRGVARYVSGLSGLKVASTAPKGASPDAR